MRTSNIPLRLRVVFTIVVAIFSARELSAQTAIKLFRGNSQSVQATTAALSNSKLLVVDPRSLASLLQSHRFILQGVPMPNVAGTPQSVDLDLTEFSVLCEQTKVTYIGNGTSTPGPLPTVRTYRGTVKGNPNTLAFIAAEPDGNVSGFIRFNGQENFTIGPARRGDNYTSMITPMSSIPGDLTSCDMADEAKYITLGSKPRELKMAPMSFDPKPLVATKTCVVAIDEDYACFNEFGDYTNYITARMAAITTVYESEIGVSMAVGPMQVFTSPDPYSGGDLNSILQSFTNYWVANHQGDADKRTLAHLVSRKLGGGGAAGVAWVEGMCQPSTIGYGLTNISGSFTGVDEAVMAHELGHNVGSQHTHNCAAYPPSGLDHCVAAEGGCSWTPTQTIGCIMSYCNQKDFSFHTRQGDDRVVQTLQAAVDAATCLATLAKITLKDTIINFPKTMMGLKKDSTITALISNTNAEADLRILSLALDGPNADQFIIKNPPKFPVVLTNGQTLNVTLTFAPQFGGDDTATLVIGHNATGGQSIVTLTGHGSAPIATFMHEADVLDFGTTSTNTPIDSTLMYVQNDGDAPLKITETLITGQFASEFSIVSGSAPSTINPGQQGSVVVRFKAKSNGFKTGYVDFKSNDPNDSATIHSVQIQASVSNLAVNATSDLGPQIVVTPNPFKGKLQFEIRSSASYFGRSVTMQVIDNLGRTVTSVAEGKLSSTSAKYSWQPDVSLAEGAYSLVVNVGEQKIVQQVIYMK